MKYEQEERFCKKMAVTVEKSSSQYRFNREGILVGVASLEGSIQSVEAEELRTYTNNFTANQPL